MSGHLDALTPPQRDALGQFKQRVSSILDPQLNSYARVFLDDSMCLRYLRARRFDLNAAYNMAYETLVWRTSFQDTGVDNITSESVRNELQAGKSFFHGADKEGRPVCIVKVQNNDPSKTDQLEAQRYSIYLMEYGKAILRPPTETVTMLFDMTNAGMRNVDLKSMQFIIHTLQNHYPESLGRVLIYNSPWFVHGVWKMIKPMLDTVTAAKVSFVDRKHISDYIGSDNLLAEYGGCDSFKYDADKYSAMVERQLHTSGLPNQ